MDWKEKLKEIKATLPQVEDQEKEDEKATAKNIQKEPLRIQLEKRNNKVVTLVSEFQGSEEELKDLARLLKMKCSSGGTYSDNQILIQGDFRVKIAEILENLGYKVKKINFK
ncbi:MAG TPA: translation initiation factor [Paludibacteraceae bacterium]|nr:translation initiation factor [Paludibacteraceae bacterium]HPC26706.1 translation initiation factor [Paludibacteraceae bacterium]HPO66781.1 translation initiation factor [Paludibacteraceae bacterium]HRR62564.1 translation initiation factor [Paludibacteraceae bacterium]HRU63804.1 translation initiation factor [Paludibacteraceae bacterium]